MRPRSRARCTSSARISGTGSSVASSATSTASCTAPLTDWDSRGWLGDRRTPPAPHRGRSRRLPLLAVRRLRRHARGRVPRRAGSARDGPWALCVGLITPALPADCPRAVLETGTIPATPTCQISQKGHLDTLHPQSQRLREYFGIVGATEEQTRRARAAYYGLVTFADERIGQVTDALERNGLADNTVVIYVSDHGEMMGEHGLWWKCSFYESSSRGAVHRLLAGPFRAGPAHCDHLAGGSDPVRARPGGRRGG